MNVLGRGPLRSLLVGLISDEICYDRRRARSCARTRRERPALAPRTASSPARDRSELFGSVVKRWVCRLGVALVVTGGVAVATMATAQAGPPPVSISRAVGSQISAPSEIHPVRAGAPTSFDAGRAIRPTKVVDSVRSARGTHQLSADPNLAFVLFVLGIAGIMFELLHPGLNLPGIAGLISFVVSLVLLGSLPVNAAGVVLVVLAFVFFAVDLRIGAHGLAVVAGGACLILGGLFLYHPSVPSAKVSIPLLIAIAVALAVFFVVVARAALRVRQEPVVTGADLLIGEEGVVTEALDPSGQVRVRGEVWAAKLEDAATGPAAVGATVVVWEIRGLTLVVEPADQIRGEPDTGSMNRR
jgi:membrane protein implicated in regulation of membrane protease activity